MKTILKLYYIHILSVNSDAISYFYIRRAFCDILSSLYQIVSCVNMYIGY